ncbi:hypothetical protein UCDDA912_g09284 [Diaporthe ampelina]|uniref:Uncharacterized protein n=1 Tax=Diaporthe ampelina TaxID=1214573 RepID=A0A0G2F9A5_9PEZI|nr:hypothetical protein UCDDA912_g09284 [Diaporthe ampelina]
MDCKMESDMDDSTNTTCQSVDGGKNTSQVQQASIGITIEDLQSAFDIQNQYIKAALDAKLDKRFPAEGNTASKMTGNLGSNLIPSGSEHADAAINIEELLQQRTNLSLECQKLQATNKLSRQRIIHLETQIAKNADLAAQVNAANQKNANLTQRMAALRQMLVPPAENQILDSEIVQRFCRIRSGIISLVRQTWRPVARPTTRSADMTPEQLMFVANDLTYDRLRSMVFLLIHKEIFHARPYGLGDAHKEFERSVRKVENYLLRNTPKENEGSIIDWRNATFKVTEGLRDVEGNLPQHTRRYIWWFLSVVQTSNPHGRDRAIQRLQAICDEAFELSMMIRKAKDCIYVESCEFAVGTPFSDHDGGMEDVTFAKADASHKRGTVAYVVYGALVKKPKDDLTRALVLEKAEVAVYH